MRYIGLNPRFTVLLTYLLFLVTRKLNDLLAQIVTR